MYDFSNNRLQSLLQGIYEKDENPGKIIIFIETKRRVESISRYIRGFGVKCGTLHGDKSQNERDFVLREFRTGKSNILVATDVAARGLGKYSNDVVRLMEKVAGRTNLYLRLGVT